MQSTKGYRYQGWVGHKLILRLVGQVRVISLIQNEDTPAQTVLPGANWQDFMFLQLFWHRRGLKFYLFCRTSGVRSSVVRQLLLVVQDSRTILIYHNVHPCSPHI